MLGGLRPDTTGIYEIGGSWQIARHPETRPTLPLHFKNEGYRTLSFGKIYHQKGTGEGFGWSETPWKLNWDCYVNFDYDSAANNKWRPAIEIYEGAESLHNDHQTAEKVIRALAENRDRPFFIAGGFFKPHLPFVAPKKYWDLYSDAEIELIHPREIPEGASDCMYAFSEIFSYGADNGKLFSGDGGIGRKQARKLIHAYYASVSFIDAQVGRILDALEEFGLADSTGLVIWSDHGFHLGDHGRWAKRTQFEQSMRAPLLVRLPGAQTVTGPTDAIVESVDIYPTLCEFAGLPVPDFLEGESFLAVLRGESDGKVAAFSQIRPVNRKERNLMGYSMRTRRYRYVEWRAPDEGNAVAGRELYDHRDDPLESINVIEQPEHAGAREWLEKEVLANYRSLQ